MTIPISLLGMARRIVRELAGDSLHVRLDDREDWDGVTFVLDRADGMHAACSLAGEMLRQVSHIEEPLRHELRAAVNALAKVGPPS